MLRLGDRYAALRSSLLREESLFRLPRQMPELEIQAHWFAGDFGREFTAVSGERIRIVQFGVWNRESGPDFADAAISIDDSEPIRGCIELDPDIRDWERHGHAQNPAYEDVILHVFVEKYGPEFFTRTASHRSIPQVQLDLAKLSTEPLNPIPDAKPGRCSGPLRDYPLERAREILHGAAEHRLMRKAATLARLAELHGDDEALFLGIATALGYKSNKLPFTLLAQRLPLRSLRHAKDDLDALLFGVAGFLPGTDLSEFPAETRQYLKSLWERWWRLRGEYERLSLAPDLWKLGGQRPANHPQRRLGALAQIIREWPTLRNLVNTSNLTGIPNFFADLHDEFWARHFTLTSKESPKPMAIVGEERVREILVNVIFPLAVRRNPDNWSRYLELRATAPNRRVAIAAQRLFGTDRHPHLLKSAAIQQGLLEIYEDFCMHDASDCADCLFPQQLRRW